MDRNIWCRFRTWGLPHTKTADIWLRRTNQTRNSKTILFWELLLLFCPARLTASGVDINNLSNCRRGSSLRQTRSPKGHLHDSDEQNLTRKRHFVPENYVSKSVDNSELTFDDINVNNQTTLEKKIIVPQSKFFLKWIIIPSSKFT